MKIGRLLAWGGFAAAATAQGNAQQQPGIPIRPLGRIVATSTELLSSVKTIRPLSDGRVLANDFTGKRVVLFDSSLTHFMTVADTTSETAKAYGSQGGGLFAFYADSSLFADLVSLSMLVIDPAGKIDHIIAAPRGNQGNLGYATSPQYGATFDGRGNILTKWPIRRLHLASDPSGAPAPPPLPDSSVIQRANIVTKKVDTVARLKAPNTNIVTTVMQMSSGTMTLSVSKRNPLPVADDWTVMGDGTIAVVRELDYHIDWIAPDGSQSSSPKIQHQWEQVSDSMKVAILDSTKHADSVTRAKAQAANAAGGNTAGRSGGGGTGGGGGAGGAGAAVEVAAVMGVSASAPNIQYVDPSDLPDYYPPFLAADTLGVGAVKADADGNVWIRTAQLKHIDGGTVFDVVNRQGTLVDRIQIPGGTTVVGFGPGVVYLSSRVGTGYQLARAKIH